MSSVIVVALSGVALAGAGAWYWKKRAVRASEPENAATGVLAGVPAEKEELFRQGMEPGADGTPVMYTLTTCRHCVYLKDFLVNNHIGHHLVYVDDFEGEARTAMMGVLRSHNPRGSFPTLVLPGGKTLVGFREAQVREAFNLPPA